MKGVIYIDSCFYEIEFEKMLCSNCSYRKTAFTDASGVIMPGSQQIVSIDWDDFEFTTDKKIEPDLRVNPFFLFCNDGSSAHDKSAYFIKRTAEFVDNKVKYKYKIGLGLPKVCLGKQKNENIPASILNLYKVYIVKKRLEQNKK